MRVRPHLLLCLLLICTQASSAHAYLNPYVRLGFGGNQMKMSDMNDYIAADVGWATLGGVPVSAHVVGPGFGPDVSAGLWLVPFLRAGAIFSVERARVTHEYSQTGFLYQDDYAFHMREVGLEAALRIPALGGVTFGGGAAQGFAEVNQTFVLNNIHGNYSQAFYSHHDCRTYKAFVGFDQTTSNGIAGYLQVGYQWRTVGDMPGSYLIDDNGTISTVPGQLAPADYSGWSVRLGCGYDVKW